MRKLTLASVLAVVAALAAAGRADTITGNVINATSGKPAAGATVTLLDPLGGMAEVATVKADSRGAFRIEAPAARGPRLVRAERAGVNYFKMLTPGTESAEISVYDAAASVDGIRGAADVVRVQADGSNLQVVELFALANNSQPPRTLAAPSTFQFLLPEGAQVDGAQAQAPNGQPISVPIKPGAGKNHYSFAFALKPGETRLEVSYHIPYNGQLAFSPALTQPFDHFVVVLPTSMGFTPKDPKRFQLMPNQQPGANVQVVMQSNVGDELGFSISGIGAFPDESESQSASASGGQAPPPDSRPGGGLGKPIDAPDGLAKYRWFILAAMGSVLIGGGIWTRERTLLAAAAAAADAVPAPPLLGSAAVPAANNARRPASRPAGAPQAAPQAVPEAPAAPGSSLLNALKEEIFALEVEHQQGKLSKEEYEKARAALEQTLQRALTRSRG